MGDERPKVRRWYDPKVRGIVFQAVLCAVVFLLYEACPMRREPAEGEDRLGFRLLEQFAGFDIGQR
jgi:ABC-type amino acid transport system permease subunit